jgi:hypothetical protein
VKYYIHCTIYKVAYTVLLHECHMAVIIWPGCALFELSIFGHWCFAEFE